MQVGPYEEFILIQYFCSFLRVSNQNSLRLDALIPAECYNSQDTSKVNIISSVFVVEQCTSYLVLWHLQTVFSPDMEQVNLNVVFSILLLKE